MPGSVDNKNPETLNNQPSTEPKASVGDLLIGIIVLSATGIIVWNVIKDGLTYDRVQKQQVTLDSLVNDSVSKTLEYEQAMHAYQKLEDKRAEIRQHFEANQITK